MSEQMEILKKLENKEISPDVAIKLLNNLSKKNNLSDNNNNNLDILNRIEDGIITPDEAISLFSENRTSDIDDDDQAASNQNFQDNISSAPKISPEEFERWKSWWMYPMYFGIGFIVLSSLWMNSAYQNSGYNFWFFFSWIPLLLGILLIVLSWRSRTGPWLHVRVRGPKEKIAISMPIPLGMTSWFLKNFGSKISPLNNTSIDEIIMALDHSTKTGSPFYVEVDEGDNGEHVEVFIG